MKRLLISLFLLAGQKNMPINSLIIGHRGASGYAPENTLAAFTCAIEMGVDMIELDVHVCASGQLVVIHDETLERTTNDHGLVAEKSLAQLQQLDAGSGEHIPTLARVIELIDKKIPLNIELKGKGTALPVAQMIEQYVRTEWQYDDFVVSSFDHAQLMQFKQACPDVRLGMLIDERITPAHIDRAHEMGVYFIGCDQKNIRQPLIDYAHERGIHVFVYTINSFADAQKQRAAGVDGMFSDYPDRISAYRSKRE